MKVNKVVNVKSHIDLLLKGIQTTKYLNGMKMVSIIRSLRFATEFAEDLDKGPIIYIKDFKGYSIAILPDHVHVFKQGKKTDVTEEEAKKIVEELEELLK